jgi:hypothetical protein
MPIYKTGKITILPSGVKTEDREIRNLHKIIA